MPQQFSPVSRPVPRPLLNDPAFSPDPRSNPHFFSMNDREEIYPASLADSLSDYAPTVPDDESQVDHSHLPPRMRLINGPDPSPPSSIHHGRSYSVPVIPVPPPVIPVPPPISRTSTPGSHLRKGSPDDRRLNVPGSAPGYASASLAAQEMWQPPPPYSDSDTDSYSSSNPQTPSATPPSASSHLPKHGSKSTPPLPIDKRTSQPPSHPVATPSASQAASQPTNGTSATKTSTVQSTAPRYPITSRNASAPELHPLPDPVDVPPRPSTVPISAPPPQPAAAPPPRRRRNSKNPSIAAAPRDLDRIDELDESDPLGFAWHHHGPYEAIAKASTHPDSASVSGQKRTQRPKRKPVQPFDVSLGVTPGQIFPSFSQYQPQNAGNGVPQQLDPNVVPPMPPSGNFPVTSPPMSPLMLPNQPRQQQPQAPSPQRTMQSQPPPPPSDPPRRAPYETNLHSPAQSVFPDARPSRQDAPSQTARPVSMLQGRPDLPSSSVVPRPDISLPPRRQEKSASLLPRHLPRKLVMPAPLQQSTQQNQRLQPGQAHVEILAQRHGPAVPPKQPSAVRPPPAMTTQQPQQQQQQPQGRAKDIPMSHGPNLLKKRHTLGAPSSGPAQGDAGDAGGSNATAAMFAARVRFAEPPKEETKEERKRREKEEAKREKEAAKREKEEAKREKERAKATHREIPMQGMFQLDYMRETEVAREREMAHMSAAAKASGRKLSKRR
ncbi:hypothetical protein C8Q80DRAFT_1264788 [Daedaleopsis nitida]|nr:hypothetical protein C8Q80DRAFT_1264788 [Daedaleopsis nitida]